MDIYPFDTLYIADLNAIQSIENYSKTHKAYLDEIHEKFPELTIWIDAGINSLQKAIEWQSAFTQRILGSETFTTLAEFQLLTSAIDASFHLSLDFVADKYTGPKELLDNAQYWPANVICMTLANVGANQGVNKDVITKLLTKAKSKESAIYAAGGVRDREDLDLLRLLGCKGTLIASALHNKQITSVDLESFFKK